MRRLALALLVAVGCSRSSPPDAVTSNRGSVDVTAAPVPPDDKLEGNISGHHISITIAEGRLAHADRGEYTWHVGKGRLVVSDSGPIADETRYLVERSPRTIVRDNDGLWIVTEVVTTAGGRVFTCLHQQTVARDGTVESKEAAARGVAACMSLKVDP